MDIQPDTGIVQRKSLWVRVIWESCIVPGVALVNFILLAPILYVLIQIMRFFGWVWSKIPLVVDWNWFNKLALGLIAVFDFLRVVANFLRQAGRAPDSFKDAMFIVEMVLKFLSYALTTAGAILKPRIKPEDAKDPMTVEDYKGIMVKKDEYIAQIEGDNESQEKEIKYLQKSKQQVIKENEDYKRIMAEKDEHIARLERDNKCQEKEIKYLHKSKQQVMKENEYFLRSLISSEGATRTNK